MSEAVEKTPERRHGSAVLSVPEFGRMLGIGKDLAYAMAREGHTCGVPLLKLGRKLAVPRVAAERMLAGELPSQEA